MALAARSPIARRRRRAVLRALPAARRPAPAVEQAGVAVRGRHGADPAAAGEREDVQRRDALGPLAAQHAHPEAPVEASDRPDRRADALLFELAAQVAPRERVDPAASRAGKRDRGAQTTFVVRQGKREAVEAQLAARRPAQMCDLAVEVEDPQLVAAAESLVELGRREAGHLGLPAAGKPGEEPLDSRITRPHALRDDLGGSLSTHLGGDEHHALVGDQGRERPRHGRAPRGRRCRSACEGAEDCGGTRRLVPTRPAAHRARAREDRERGRRAGSRRRASRAA